MKIKKKPNIKSYKVRNYKDGYFVEPYKYDDGDFTNFIGSSKGVNAINGASQLAASGVNMLQPSNGDTNKWGSAGSGALSGLGEGAKLGSAFGPEGTLIGAGVGAVAGGVAGFISSGKKHNAYEQQQRTNTQNAYFSTRGNMQTQNIDPYGSQMADGDTVPKSTTSKYSPRDYTISYTNSQIYKDRLAKTGGSTKPQDVNQLYNTQVTYNKNNDTEAFPTRNYGGKNNKLNFNTDQIKKMGANQDEVAAHEWSHISRPLSNKEQLEIFNLSKNPMIKEFQKEGIYNESTIPNWTRSINNTGNDFHDLRPDENKADLDALRYQMYKKGIYDTSKGDIDEATMNKALSDPDIKNSFTTKRLLQNFDPKSLIQMNNTIASTGDNQDNQDNQMKVNNTGYYLNGASIGLTGAASGKFHVPNAGLRRFAPHMPRVGRPNPLPPNNINFGTTSQDDPQHMAYGDTIQGGNPANSADQSVPTNSMQNQINIQKGELLIHPDTGKILQEYNGVNPLTGGMFEPHAKDQSKESPNNFTLADPGLFVITKKTAKQYKDAIDNNDKISQKTVLMNIRNAKIAKEGGLQPQGGMPDDSQVEQGNYADGDQVLPDGTVLKGSDINTMNGITGNSSNSITSPNNIGAQPWLSPQEPKQSGWSKAADALTNYGPAAFNIAQGLFGNTQHQAYATPVTNPYASNVIANMPKNVNMQSTINDINSNQELANKSIQGQTSSAAIYRANREGIVSNTNRSLEDARMKSAEINNQAAGQRAYMYNALGYQNQQEQDQQRNFNLGVDEINAKRTAAKQNLLNAGLEQLQQTAQNDKLNKQKAGMDKYSMDLLSQTFPNTRYYNQFQIDYVNKLLGR